MFTADFLENATPASSASSMSAGYLRYKVVPFPQLWSRWSRFATTRRLHGSMPWPFIKTGESCNSDEKVRKRWPESPECPTWAAGSLHQERIPAENPARTGAAGAPDLAVTRDCQASWRGSDPASPR